VGRGQERARVARHGATHTRAAPCARGRTVDHDAAQDDDSDRRGPSRPRLTDTQRKALPPLPAELEAMILAVLSRVPDAADYAAQARRRRALLEIMQAIASPWREALAARLADPHRDDLLVSRLIGGLAGVTIDAFLRALGAKVVARPPGDELAAPSIAVSTGDPEEPVILDPVLAPSAVLTATASIDPALKAPGTTVRWTTSTGSAQTRPVDQPAPFTVAVAGPYAVHAEVIQDGLVVQTADVELTVEALERTPDTTDDAGEDLIAGLSVPASALTAAHRGLTARLADTTLSPDVRHAVLGQRAIIETAAAHRAVPLEAEVDVGIDPVRVGTVDLPTDPVQVRTLLEQIYAKQGRAAIQELEDGLVDQLLRGDPTDADDPAPWAEKRQPLLEQVRLLRSDLDDFVRRFGTGSRDAALAALEDSRAGVLAELTRYGLVDPRVGDPNDVDVGPPQANTEAGVMAAAGAKLAEDQRDLDELRERRYHALVEAHYRFERWDSEPVQHVDAAHAAMSDADLGTLTMALTEEADAFAKEHDARIKASVAAYPVLARYLAEKGKLDGPLAEVDAGGLERLADWRQTTDILNRECATILDNIDRTAEALRSGDLSVWREARVVQLGRVAMNVAPGSILARAVEEKVEDESGTPWTQWAVMALTFALAVVAALPTGGSSLVAGAVILAEVGTLLLDVAMISASLDEYRIQTAAAGTDFDRTRAIAADDPSMLWLAIDIAAAAVDLGAAAKTFRTVSTLAKGAAAMTDVEREIAIAMIHAHANAGKLSAAAALRLERQIRGGAAAMTLGDAGAEAARIAGAAAGARPVIKESHLAALSRKLGVPVELDDTLEDGIRVVGEVTTTGQVEVQTIRAGRDALLAEVIGHGATLGRITRYNGLVGKVRRLWDQLTAMLRGLPPPPGAGSRAFQSLEEIRKLRESIDRAVFLRAQGVIDPRVLDEEIAFLQGELAHHEDLVRGLRDFELRPGGFFIERPRVGQRTAEALQRGYKLPDQHPEYYYYRLSDTRPDVYELAIKPSAPKDVDLPTLYAEVKIDAGVATPTGYLLPGRPRTPAIGFAASEADAVVVGHVRTMSGFAEHGDMLVKHGLATEDEIAATIAHLRKGRDTTDQVLRHRVKEEFKDRVLAHLNDKALSNEASYARMRAMLDPLPVSDRGSLAELWYKDRFAPTSVRHESAALTYELDDGGELVEERVVDLFDGEMVTEVKTGHSLVDKDQFDAYMKMVRDKQRLRFGGEAKLVQRVRYAFLDPEGAAANLPWIAEKVEREGLTTLTIDVFDAQGRQTTLSSATQIRAYLRRAP
jgi:hypothetical protein